MGGTSALAIEDDGLRARGADGEERKIVVDSVIT